MRNAGSTLPQWDGGTSRRNLDYSDITDPELERLYDYSKKPRLAGVPFQNNARPGMVADMVPYSPNMIKFANRLNTASSNWREKTAKLLSRLSYADLTVPFGKNIGSLISTVISCGVDIEDVLIFRPSAIISENSENIDMTEPRSIGFAAPEQGIFISDEAHDGPSEEFDRPRMLGAESTENAPRKPNVLPINPRSEDVINIHEISEFFLSAHFESPYILQQLKPSFVSCIQKSQDEIGRFIGGGAKINELFILGNPRFSKNDVSSSLFMRMILEVLVDQSDQPSKNLYQYLTSNGELFKKALSDYAKRKRRNFDTVWFHNSLSLSNSDEALEALNLDNELKKTATDVIKIIQRSLSKEGFFDNVFNLTQNTDSFFYSYLESVHEACNMLYVSLILGSPLVRRIFDEIQIDANEPNLPYSSTHDLDDMKLQQESTTTGMTKAVERAKTYVGGKVDDKSDDIGLYSYKIEPIIKNGYNKSYPFESIYTINCPERAKQHEIIEDAIIEHITTSEKDASLNLKLLITGYSTDVELKREIKKFLRYAPSREDAVLNVSNFGNMNLRPQAVDVDFAVTKLDEIETSARQTVWGDTKNENPDRPWQFGLSEDLLKKNNLLDSYRKFKRYNFIAYLQEIKKRCESTMNNFSGAEKSENIPVHVVSTQCHNIMILLKYVERVQKAIKENQNLYDIFFNYDYKKQYALKPIEYLKNKLDAVESVEASASNMSLLGKALTTAAAAAAAAYTGSSVATVGSTVGSMALNSSTVTSFGKLNPIPTLGTSLGGSNSNSNRRSNNTSNNRVEVNRSERKFDNLLSSLRDFNNAAFDPNMDRKAERKKLQSILQSEINEINEFKNKYEFQKREFEASFGIDRESFGGLFLEFIDEKIFNPLIDDMKKKIGKMKLEVMRATLSIQVPHHEILFPGISSIEITDDILDFNVYFYEKDLAFFTQTFFNPITSAENKDASPRSSNKKSWKEKIYAEYGTRYIMEIAEDLGRRSDPIRAWKNELSVIPADDIVSRYGIKFLANDVFMKRNLAMILQENSFFFGRNKMENSYRLDADFRRMHDNTLPDEFQDPYEDITDLVNELWIRSYSISKMHLGMFIIQSTIDGISELKSATDDARTEDILQDTFTPLFLKVPELRHEFARHISLSMKDSHLFNLNHNRIQGRGDQLRRLKIDKCRSLHEIERLVNIFL
jgi:hypothetical protein